MVRDRLKSRLRKKAIRNAVFVLLGVVALGIFLFTFGIQLLIHFSLFLARNNSEPNVTTESVNYVAAPDLNPVDSATNSAKVNISGTTSVDRATVKLYVNDTLEDTIKANDKKEFTFKNVELEEGNNEIKAKVVNEDDRESDYSDPVTIIYSNKAPELTIDYPSDGQTLKNEHQTLTGKTGAGASVTVNGFRAIVEADGKFSYDIKLNQGGNNIKIVTTDSAGNKTEKEMNVTYSP